MTMSVNAVGFTSQITAGFRAVELQHIADPIISDELSPFLAGAEGLRIAVQDWEKLVQHQGPGKHLRVPARNRIVDDALLEALEALAAPQQQQPSQQQQQVTVQVVNIGCGMDSKPWRLQLPASCKHLRLRWFDVDQPGVIQLKQQLLQQAGAAMPQQQASPEAAPPAGAVRFPLLVDSWVPVAADLARVSLAAALDAPGFAAQGCTVWLAEALIYYVPLQNALQLLSDMARLSCPGSRLVATCIDRELYINHLHLEKKHYFAEMWHFSTDELLGPSSSDTCISGRPDEGSDRAASSNSGSVLQQAGWQLDSPALTSAVLARQLYGKDTYVALYGGAECCFTARLTAPSNAECDAV